MASTRPESADRPIAGPSADAHPLDAGRARLLLPSVDRGLIRFPGGDRVPAALPATSRGRAPSGNPE